MLTCSEIRTNVIPSKKFYRLSKFMFIYWDFNLKFSVLPNFFVFYNFSFFKKKKKKKKNKDETLGACQPGSRWHAFF